MTTAVRPRFSWPAASVVLLATVVGVWAVARHDPGGRQGSGLPRSFAYNLAALPPTDPALVLYRPAGEIPLGFQQPRGLAVGPADQVYVVGDRGLKVFSSDGRPLRDVPLPDESRALAVGGPDHAHPGRIYVGLADRIDVLDPEGKKLATWTVPGRSVVLTSVAAGDKDVYVADAGQRLVFRFDPDGKLLGRIGGRDPALDQDGFVVPSPHLDVVLTPDGLVRVVNPGKHRVEAYTPEGHREAAWGQAGEALDRFCGCCNPVALALLPDGRYVTAEKGIPRVKVHRADGTFQGVVAPTELLAPRTAHLEETRPDYQLDALDVAADSRGRVLVLDPAARKVRLFESREAAAKEKP